MPEYRFSTRSYRNLEGVRPELIAVASRALAISPIDFVVIEGLRTKERQRGLVNTGASQTLNSRHLTGHAIDLAAWVDGDIRWDWPLYAQIAEAMKKAALGLGVHLEWGGDWQRFKDGPHFQLPWSNYPA
jgi:peptidoglycan L-alanyl-D-glutamate endopeptidase CwlK